MASQREVVAWQKQRQKALDQYVQLASVLPSVACIALVDDFDPDIFTYIDQRDMQVLEAERPGCFDHLSDTVIDSILARGTTFQRT